MRRDWTRFNREWRSSKRAILAFHMGGWRKGESPLDALARALGVASKDLLLEKKDPRIERNELDQLAACLGADWIETPGLNIEESLARAMLLLNQKLSSVPTEVRAFFDAPGKLEPLASAQTTTAPDRLPLLN